MNARVLGMPVPTLVMAAVGLVVFIGIPLTTDTFTTFEFTNVAVYAIALMGLNILTGYSGQISLGNGAFMAVGGYTTALMVHKLQIPWYATIPIAGVFAGVIGFLFGFPALRLSGIYLALATFALALAIPPLIDNFDTFTNGHSGINMKSVRPPDFISLSPEQWLYFICWTIAAVMFLLSILIIRSGIGRAFMAIRDSETAAVSSGVSLSYYKTLAFGTSALFSGVAGSLLAIIVAYVNPDVFGLQLSLTLLVGAVIGGIGLQVGPLLGALFLVWLPYYAEKSGTIAIGGLQLPQKPDIYFGILLLVILFFAPDGIAGLFARGMWWYRSRRSGVRAQSLAEDGATPEVDVLKPGG